jgi:hypothetical protein
LCSNKVTLLLHPYFNTELGRKEWDRLGNETTYAGRALRLCRDSKVVLVDVCVDLPSNLIDFYWGKTEGQVFTSSAMIQYQIRMVCASMCMHLLQLHIMRIFAWPRTHCRCRCRCHSVTLSLCHSVTLSLSYMYCIHDDIIMIQERSTVD